MNYFAHGIRFLERPWFLAGTAVPDLLSAIDRPVRVRSRDAEPFVDDPGTQLAELAAGIRQHHLDDGWFHSTADFLDVSHQLTRRFRDLLTKSDESPRAPFLGHIVTELLLDAVLIARNPERIERYYQQMAQVDPGVFQVSVNRMSRRPTERLAAFLPLFCAERFLPDYVDSTRLWRRLNQVLRRVTLDPLPEGTPAVLDDCRTIVESRRHDLLPGYEPYL